MSGGAARRRRLAALVRKEGLQILRDPSSILIAFVLPAVLLFLFGYAVSLDVTHNRIGLVLENPTPQARDLAAGFRGSPYFEVEEGRDRRAFEAAVAAGRLRGVVVVPARFAALLAAGRPAPVQVLVDGSDPNTAALVRNDVQGVLSAWNAARSDRGPAIGLETRVWFNPALESRDFLVPGAIVIVMTLVGTLLTSLVIAREWERGTMEAVMATPVTAGELLAGKVVPYFALGLLSMTLCVALAVGLFGVPLRGSLGALYLLAATFLVPALGQGLLISALTRNQFLASQLALISAFLPSYMLSGFIFEIESMPAVIRALTRVLPARYLVPALQSVFLVGDVWPLFWRSMAYSLLIGGVFFLIAARDTRKRIG